MKASLLNLIKYSLGYIRLTRSYTFLFTQRKLSVELPEKVFDLKQLLKNDVEETSRLLISLQTFYTIDPKKITLEIEEEYERERKLAEKLEEIYNTQRTDPYTKQVMLSFGHFEVEIPLAEEAELRQDYYSILKNSEAHTKFVQYPLFSIPISVEKIFEKGAGKYFIKPLDPQIQVNVRALIELFKENENLYYKLVEELGKYEEMGSLLLPISQNEVFEEIWNKVRAQLKLTNAKFDENSFTLGKLRISIVPRGNYFIEEDLQKLSKLTEEDFKNTSLIGWIEDKDLDIESEIPPDGELFFPFPYDEHQLKILSLIGNKMAIVQGPPGTGKSQTIANLICHFASKGKKVLFVSQKDQALRVVKDMLKKLNIKYLFGYIPNIGSIYTTEEDKLDGIAPQLTQLEPYIENLGVKIIPRRKYPVLQYSPLGKNVLSREDIQKLINKGRKLKEAFNKAIETQRRIYKLMKELSYLKQYEIKVTNLERFKNNFSEEIWRKLDSFLNKLQLLSEKIKEHETDNKTFKRLWLRYWRWKIKKIERRMNELLNNVSLNRENFAKINQLIYKKGFKEVKDNIIRTQELRRSLETIQTEDPNKLYSRLKGLKKQEKIALYLQNIINKNLREKWKEEGLYLRRIVRSLAKAFSKSKRAFKTYDRLKKEPDNFLKILGLIPVWIMELDDASRILPLKPGMFDYVIFDEASQCNFAFALPAMFRARNALFVGDSEQMRDNTILFKPTKAFDELARRYQIPEEFQIKATGEPVQSVLDIARLRGCKEIVLRNHYRSPRELIGFSNQYFYKPKGKELIVVNSNYFPWKDTNRIMMIHQVKVDWEKEFSDKINISEAEAILNFFKELRSDSLYRDKSIGILSFFNEQAIYIRKLFEKHGYREENDNYKIGIIEGIQGEEKDIIIYSFVIRTPEEKKRYVPLTSEGGDVRKEINKGRVNVAFSRAKLQTHCFISMPIEEFPKGIWIRKYLEYVRDNGKIDFFSQQLKPFESKFEEEFYYFLKSKLPEKIYIIQNQVKSCGFRIDFVITNIKNGKKIAIECDGPTHFVDEIDEDLGIYVESDVERQKILEAAGWSFYRVRYSDWIDKNFNKNSIIEDLVSLLS